MRGRACAALMALLACGDDDDDTKPVRDASAPIDGKVAVMDATLMERCRSVPACHAGAIEQLPELCFGSVKAQPNGALHKVCVVDPQGRGSFIEIRADERITSPGWTWSYYALVDGTLSDEGTEACLEERAKQIVPTEDDLPGAPNALCYRTSANQSDD